MLHERSSGDFSSEDARPCRENGSHQVPLVLYIAMSMFAAMQATFINILADNGMLIHVQYLREQLDGCALTAIRWIDTRDMVTVGTTTEAADSHQNANLLERHK